VTWRTKSLMVGLSVVLGVGAFGCAKSKDDDGAARAESTTTRPAETTTTVPPPRSFTLVAAGDVLLHSALWDQAKRDAAAEGRDGMDFESMLAAMKPMVSAADLAICHMETPIAPPDGPYSSFPVFSVPEEIVPALAATGFDACTTGSNHTLDKGAAGIDRTLAAFDAAGMKHAGSARFPEEAATTTFIEANGVAVAMLSYAFGFNGFSYPNGETWRANQIDEGRILADAAAARQRGAEVVVVSLHWGNEYVHEPNAQQNDLAPRLIRSPDIDLLLGHHAHVVQPVQNIDGEWVVYGMGNMIANQLEDPRAEGLLTRFTFTEVGDRVFKVTDAAFEPLLTLHGATIRLLPVGTSLANGSADPGLQQRLVEARDRTTGIVGQRGALQAGLHPIA
jgi:poly-gamma-glutamate synthesis protein (capsule biosynthesis protein)